MIRVTFPTNYRKRRTPFKNVYASGFNISLSYDEINYSDSVTLVIYNDLCYSCSASTMECNMTVRKRHCWPSFHILYGIKNVRFNHICSPTFCCYSLLFIFNYSIHIDIINMISSLTSLHVTNFPELQINQIPLAKTVSKI